MKRAVFFLIAMIRFASFAQSDEEKFVMDSPKHVFTGDRTEFLSLFNIKTMEGQPEQSYVAICPNKAVAKFAKKKNFQTGVTVYFQDNAQRWQTAAVFYRYKKSDTSGRITKLLVSSSRTKLAIKVQSKFLNGEAWFLYEFRKKASYWYDLRERKYSDTYVSRWIN